MKSDLELYQELRDDLKKKIDHYNKEQEKNKRRYSMLIKELREQLQISQEEFANRCGHTSDNARSWASKLESGRIKLSLDDATTVATALGISPIELLYPDLYEDIPKINLTNDEDKIIENYRKLSENGKNKVSERIDELLQLEGVKA